MLLDSPAECVPRSRAFRRLSVTCRTQAVARREFSDGQTTAAAAAARQQSTGLAHVAGCCDDSLAVTASTCIKIVKLTMTAQTNVLHS